MIDHNRINELRSEVGEDNFAEILELFIDEMDEAITKLETAPDISKLEARLHFLKGSALNLGLTDLMSLCHKGERAAANAQYDHIDVDEILQTYHMTRAALIEHTNHISSQHNAL